VQLLFRYMAMYREEARRAGYEPSPDQLGWSIQIYVAESDAVALREARPHIEAFVNKFLRMPTEMLLPPGYLSLASMRGVMQAKRALSGPARSVEQLMEQGTFLCGSPATIAEKLAGFQDQAGFNLLLPGLQFGTLPAELTRKNMTMFATEVMPLLRDRLPQAPSGSPLPSPPPQAEG
jgi:alkanesulfonate monooxygenase SsuD/methylene tetrahydromethanopterin reductase-like flavin-dependent oxidoreductase (luciferase family)